MKTIYIDIDETICHNTIWNDHTTAKPLTDRITMANDLFDAGHKIVYWTARGSTTNRDWSDLTKKQLNEWGVKYHELKFGKPFYDLFIDDKAINADDWKKTLQNL